jgi:hypothetical protein
MRVLFYQEFFIHLQCTTGLVIQVISLNNLMMAVGDKMMHILQTLTNLGGYFIYLNARQGFCLKFGA